MKTVSRILCVVILSWAASVQAGSSGWTDYAEVLEIEPTIHQRYRVRIAVTDNESGCKEKQWFYQDYDLPGSREMFITLLEGLSRGIKVRVYVTGRCDINHYSEISSVGMRIRDTEK